MPRVLKEKSGKWKVTCEYDEEMKVVDSDILGVKYECEFGARMSAEKRAEAAENMVDVFKMVLQRAKVDAYASGGASQFNTLFANARGNVAGCNGLLRSLKVVLTVCMCSRYAGPDRKAEIVIEVKGGKGKKEFKIPLNRINVTGPGDYSTDLEAGKVQAWNRDVVQLMGSNNVFA